MKHKNNQRKPFPTLPVRQLVERFNPAVYVDNKDSLASILFRGMGPTVRVPIEVACHLHRALGDAIADARRVNEYKILHGCNPAL